MLAELKLQDPIDANGTVVALGHAEPAEEFVGAYGQDPCPNDRGTVASRAEGLVDLLMRDETAQIAWHAAAKEEHRPVARALQEMAGHEVMCCTLVLHPTCEPIEKWGPQSRKSRN